MEVLCITFIRGKENKKRCTTAVADAQPKFLLKILNKPSQ